MTALAFSALTAASALADAFVPPCYIPIDGDFTVIDADDDGFTWTQKSDYWYVAANDDDLEVTKNDWLITPAVTLVPGKAYTFNFQIHSKTRAYPERYEVMMGSGYTVDAMTKTLMEPTVSKTNTYEDQSIRVTVETAGDYYFGIHAISDADMDELLVTNFSVKVEGETEAGAPAAPKNVVATFADGVASISWDAVTTDTEGNDLTGTVTYNIYRVVEGEEITLSYTTATSCTDAEAEPGECYYNIVATCGGKASLPGSSNTITVKAPVVGVDVPYTNTFDSEDALADFTIINANADYYTWKWEERDGDGMAIIYTNPGDYMNDWLITPALNLRAGVTYYANFYVFCGSEYYPEEVEVFLGTDNTAEAMTTTVLADTSVDWTVARRCYGTITVPTDGAYFFGIHATSEAFTHSLAVTNIEILPEDQQDVYVDAPAAAPSFTITDRVLTATAPVSVYATTGALVARTSGSVTLLPGVYIVNGEKVIIK